MKVTLLITTYNRDTLLRNNLERLCLLSIPDEVLIVDDGSSDNTQGVYEDFRGRLPLRYIYNHNPNWSICSMARNIGVKNAIGDIIITAEPELIFVTDIVKQMLETRLKYPREIVSVGTMYFQQSVNARHPLLAIDPKAALKDSIIENYEIQPRSYRTDGFVKTVNMQATFSALYEKEWLMELGGWDEEFPGAYGFDDIELCTRLRINGINQKIDWDMEAIHQWHPHLPPHIQGPMVAENDEYMKSKRLDLLDRGDPGLVANKGREWGIIIPRGN